MCNTRLIAVQQKITNAIEVQYELQKGTMLCHGASTRAIHHRMNLIGI